MGFPQQEIQNIFDSSLFRRAMRTMLDNSYNGFLVIDKDAHIVYANKWYEDFMNIQLSEVTGKTIDSVFPNSKLKRILIDQRIERNKYDTRFKRPVMINRFPIYDADECIGAIALFREINEIEKPAIDLRRQMAESGFCAKYTFQDIISKNERIDRLKEIAKLYADSSLTVLMTGESGTGKELFAQSIHNSSRRKNMPFVALNCTTLTETILESELFGYADASFTGAKKGGKLGLFQIAHKGTLFLDEIGEIPLSFQSKLLRVIQEQQVRPVGSNAIIPIDVRIIAATNKDLKSEVEAERFRLDLYYRLNVLSLNLPPLRERTEDLYDISKTIFKRKGYMNLWNEHTREISGVLTALKGYDFPGNIRELENILDRLAVLLGNNLFDSDSGVAISQLIEGFSGRIGAAEAGESFPARLKQTTDLQNFFNEKEKQQMIDLLLEYGGNKAQVAEKLGISLSTLYRKTHKYNIVI